MRRRTQLDHLHSIELGASLPFALSYRCELDTLKRLRPSEKVLNPTTFTNTIIHARHAYITQFVPSPDRHLVAVASSDGSLEIHEPEDDKTLRLTILARNAKLASVAWGSLRGSECVILGLVSPRVALYDLETCQVDTPTREFAHDARSLSDIAVIDNHVFATTTPKRITLFDARVRKRITDVAVPYNDAVLEGEDVCLYAADVSEVALWDRRKMASCARVGIMEKRQDCALSRQRIGSMLPVRFNSIKRFPNSPPGILFVHMADGTIGHVDMVGKTHHVKEEKIVTRPAVNEELSDYGRLEEETHYPWYVHRRRADLLVGQFNLGWRALLPSTAHPNKYRLIGFDTNMKMKSHTATIPTDGPRPTGSNDKFCICMHAVNGKLDRVMMGGIRNHVDVYDMQYDRNRETASPENNAAGMRITSRSSNRRWT